MAHKKMAYPKARKSGSKSKAMTYGKKTSGKKYPMKKGKKGGY